MDQDETIQDMVKKWRGQLSRGILELLILTSLQKERYGWDILQLIRSILPPSEPTIADGTIYNILNRLKKRELLTTENKIIDGRMMEPVWITRTEDIRKKDDLIWMEQKSIGARSKLLKKSS